MGAELFHADRQIHRGMERRTDMTKLIVTFRNFVSTIKLGV